MIAERLGHKARLEVERGYHVDYQQPSSIPTCPYMLADAKMVVTPMDGRVRGAGLVEFGGLDAPASPTPGKPIDRALAELYPGFRYRNRSEWMGFRPSTVDSLPLLGSSPASDAICFAFGHQHIGLTAGPKSGRIIADFVAGRKTNADLTPFAVGRFD